MNSCKYCSLLLLTLQRMVPGRERGAARGGRNRRRVAGRQRRGEQRGWRRQGESGAAAAAAVGGGAQLRPRAVLRTAGKQTLMPSLPLRLLLARAAATLYPPPSRSCSSSYSPPLVRAEQVWLTERYIKEPAEWAQAYTHGSLLYIP